MNIFFLHEDPKIAASMHCDQHLHKMILESAQMLSTVARHYAPWRRKWDDVYKPTHLNHPCNLWLQQAPENALWLTSLASNLNSIRMSLGSDSHASMRVIELTSTIIEAVIFFKKPENNLEYYEAKNPIFCGDSLISLTPTLTVPEKYQRYYILKLKQWLDKGKPMSYKGRPIPEFLLPYAKDIIQ